MGGSSSTNIYNNISINQLNKNNNNSFNSFDNNENNNNGSTVIRRSESFKKNILVNIP